MNELGYEIKTPVFEGPLDLLLDLIEKRKLFVNDVSLAQVTDDFIKYLQEQEASNEPISLRESAEFIVVASTLMLIKSRSLLPSLPLTEEETASIEELEERLRLYEKVRELSNELKKRFGKEVIFAKEPSRQVTVVFSPDSNTNLDGVSQAIKRLIDSFPVKEKTPKATIKKIITLEEMIFKLTERMQKGLKTKFSEVYKKEDKMNVIVGFLAVLELVRRGVMRVEQDEKGEIEMETENVTVPHYV